MTLDVRAIDLNRLNSASKYPSIPTYHQLDPRNGQLLDDTVTFTGPVIGTEKIDGTNARIILVPDLLPDGNPTWVIGSREELLHAQGDLIANPAQGIAAALAPTANCLISHRRELVVFYVELYGGKIGAGAKHYTGHRGVDWRLFDIAVVPNPEVVLDWSAEKISAWRDEGGQTWLAEDDLLRAAAEFGLALAPRLFTLDAGGLPAGLAETRAFLAHHLPATRVAIDGDANGEPEGIVLRSPGRATIAKARFGDYDRTLRRQRAGSR